MNRLSAIICTATLLLALPSVAAADECGTSVQSIERTSWANVICADGSGHSVIECDPANQDANLAACEDAAHTFCSQHLLACAEYSCAGTTEQKGDCQCGSAAISCAKQANGWK
ncbi:MAG: hypothetical protein AUK47_01845 [Deltaproteobacteria bacterium CG2_30_63_29]|nr:MAG: hypothetical protein AUK47_01845 [Deltaproteobacteria bacterium CG2_30_63_29]PIV98769.1 MAG: hypothetical protein COW42_13240 [Deltaproteobacteria bacterium CG17_big_fil_post_rev_8_21_14_2_50_63_7]